jgi:hypothetical protein
MGGYARDISGSGYNEVANAIIKTLGSKKKYVIFSAS